VRRGLLAAWICAVAALVWWRGVPFERAQVLIVCLTGLLAASAGQPGRAARAMVDWVPVALALAAFDLLRGVADDTGIDVQVSFPADVERWLFGTVPTVWLQERLADGPTWLIVAESLLYASHFIAPFAVAAIVWWRLPSRWQWWRRRFLGVTVVALVCFLLVPVAPPWVAGRVGEIGPVARTANVGWESLGLDVASDVISYGQATTNLFAAMPSLHAAYALLTAVTVFPLLSRAGRLVALTYPLGVGFTLVATGEHYAVDVVAGWLLVGVVGVACRSWERRGDAIIADRWGWAPPPVRRWWGPVLATSALAVVLRVNRLGTPRVFVYDEVFYVNDALDIALSGRQPDAFHPPFAKLLIAPLLAVGGVEPVVWRLPQLLCGVGVVAGTAGAAWLATHDRRLSGLAGLLAATDGLAFVTGRLGLLEAAVSLCVAGMLVGLLGIYGATASATRWPWWAPALAMVSAAVGLATKWSVVPAALVTVVAVAWPLARRLGRPPILVGGILALVVVGGSAVAWGPVATRPGVAPALAPAVQASAVVANSLEMLDYQTGLERSGPGHAAAWTWVLQTSPTVLYELPCDGALDSVDGVCRPGTTATARIVAAGNPVLWVAGTIAFVVLIARRPRSPQAVVTVALGAALWVPWLLPGARPYSYYGAALVPVLAVAVAMTLQRSRWRVGASVVVGAAAVAWFLVRFPDLAALT
jgi:predicted membrane-bound dolichyl-phosphate-mannose-protein mannosyltransferase